MENIGQKLREKRKEKNLTIEQLSKKANVSKSFLSQIERNISQPSINLLNKISIAYGIGIQERRKSEHIREL